MLFCKNFLLHFLLYPALNERTFNINRVFILNYGGVVLGIRAANRPPLELKFMWPK